MSFVTAEGYKNYVKGFVVKFINDNGKLPTKKDMVNQNISIDPLITTYGGWNNVLKALGFDRDTVEENINDEEVMAKLKELQEKLGTVPTLTHVKQEKINIKGLQNKFGSWNNIKKILKGELDEEKAQEEKTKRNIFDLEETTEELIALTKELGDVPKIAQAKSRGINVNRLIKMFGSWTNAKKELNLYSAQEEAVVAEITDLQRQTIKRPTIQKIKENNINIKPLIKKYGSWKQACNVLNIDLYDLECIKDEILQVAKDINKKPTVYELKKYGVNIKPLSQEYGGWYNIVREMELEKFDENRTMEQIQEVANIIDKTPTIKDLREHHVKTTKIFKTYGGWNKLREAMGLPKFSRYTNSELSEREEELKALGDTLGRTPTLKDVKDYNIHVSPLINRYGSWNNLLFKLGFKLNNRYTEEAIDALTNEVQELADRLGKAPTMKEVKENNIPLNPLKRKYGSFGKCLLAIGLKPRVLSHKLFDKDEVMAELKALSTELGKVPSMKTAKNHGIKVHSLIKEMGSWGKVKEALATMEEQTVAVEPIELRLA